MHFFCVTFLSYGHCTHACVRVFRLFVCDSTLMYFPQNDIFSFLFVGGAGGYSSGGFPGGFQFTFG